MFTSKDLFKVKNMKLCREILLLLVMCQLSKAKLPINVTVMVPGISAFTNLAALTYKLQNRNPDDATTTEADETNIENDPPYIYDSEYDSSLQDYNYSDETLHTKCRDKNTNNMSVVCLHNLANFVTYPWSYMFVKPALEVALKTIRNTKGLLDHFDVNLIYYDSGDTKGKTSARFVYIIIHLACSLCTAFS